MNRARRQQYMLRTEASEQEAVITICKFMENRYPELKLLHHCPNGGKRDRVSAAVLKRQAADYGNFVAICYSQEIALKVIEEYVKLNQQDAMPIENNKVIKIMAEME